MSSPENIREEYKHALEQHVPLIYGLPDDLAILCLSKVPRQFHHVLRCVSKRWSALLGSKEFSSCRSRQNLKETWIYAMCVNKYRVNCCYVLNPNPNPSSWHWKLLQRIPSECMGREGMSFEALGNKLFLLGGCGCQQNPTDEVYSYDTSTEKWEKAAKMPTARCYFLSAAVGDKIYVTGGLGMSSDASKSWDIYDYHSNNWSSYQDTSIIPDIVKSFIFEGKVYTIHNTWIDRQYARVYDPSSRKWEEANQQMSSCARGPTVVIQDTLYMLDETYGTRLMMWQNEAKEWVPLGRLAQMLTKPPCQLVAVGSCIFIVGQKLSTVVVDMKKATQIGVLVGSSLVRKLDNDLSVISCKTVAI